MQYESTRGEAPVLGFKDVLLTGLARDGGLYLPTEWPQISAEEIRTLAGKPYADVAKTILYPFVKGEIPKDVFAQMVDEAYATFHHPAVAPLIQIGANGWVMELFHGPTLAFKDVAMQLLSRLMDFALAERGSKATIVGATSGDTGSAAIEAFKGRENTDIFILFPKGKVSPVQQRQMTTVDEANVYCIAVEGDFDDCQALVKEMFNHHDFRDRLQLTGVNSINWGRIMAQIVYYFTTAVSLGSPDKPVSFCVPSGNFGDIFAGYAAKRMGLPIDQMVIATNRNDILTRTLSSGRYETAKTMPSISPSMDIQVSSNFERLLYEACDRDAAIIREQMASLKQSGSFAIGDKALAQIRAEFSAGACDETQTGDQIKLLFEQTGYLCDPHTAVGLHVASSHSSPNSPMVTLATAHPAKFPAAVKRASGLHPDLPARMGDMMSRDEKFSVVANSISAVESLIEKHSRATSK